MRWRITSFLFLVVLGLLAAAGHFLLGWWQPSRPVAAVTGGGYNVRGEPTTLPEVLAAARVSLEEIKHNVRDYSAVLLKKEHSGSATAETSMFLKFREQPFSVYLYYLKASDKDIAGREVIYVQGRNDNNLLVHTPGLLDKTLGTMHLDPTGILAMNGEQHSILDTGLANLCRQLIERGESADPARARVRRFSKARINDRACYLLEIYPIRGNKDDGDYLVRVFVDNQWKFPIRVEIYKVPPGRKQEPELQEEYTYLDVKLNNGYTGADFDPKNRQYKFP